MVSCSLAAISAESAEPPSPDGSADVALSEVHAREGGSAASDSGDACLCANPCFVNGYPGQYTEEIDQPMRILLDPIAAAHGRWRRWRGPPDVGPPEGIGRVHALPPKVSPARALRRIHRVVERHLREVTYCYEQQLRVHSELRGHVEIEFRVPAEGGIAIVADGRSRLTEHERSSFCWGNTRVFIPPRERGEVADCVASVMKGWRFPRPTDGIAVDVVQSFELAPVPSR